jgi:hypothetical protein
VSESKTSEGCEDSAPQSSEGMRTVAVSENMGSLLLVEELSAEEGRLRRGLGSNELRAHVSGILSLSAEYDLNVAWCRRDRLGPDRVFARSTLVEAEPCGSAVSSGGEVAAMPRAPTEVSVS